MKKLISKTLILLSLAIHISCSSVQDQSKNSSEGLILKANLGGINYLDTNKIVHISTTISNHSEDTLRFISMSCSYEDFFLVGENNEYNVRSRYDCYSNVPITVVIPPDSETKRFIMISLKDKSQKIHSGELKIGMQYIQPDQIEKGLSFYENRFEVGKTVWSNEIDLNELYRNVYKIPVPNKK